MWDNNQATQSSMPWTATSSLEEISMVPSRDLNIPYHPPIIISCQFSFRFHLESCLEMEIEFLPDTGSFLDLSHEIGRDVVFRELIVDMNYFVCPSLPLIGRELSPPISSRPAEAQKEELVGESKHASVVLPAAIPVDHHRHGLASQVFFEKPKDNEFVDMKVESPGGATLTDLEPEGKEEAKAKDDRKGEGCRSANSWNRRLAGRHWDLHLCVRGTTTPAPAAEPADPILQLRRRQAIAHSLMTLKFDLQRMAAPGAYLVWSLLCRLSINCLFRLRLKI